MSLRVFYEQANLNSSRYPLVEFISNRNCEMTVGDDSRPFIAVWQLSVFAAQINFSESKRAAGFGLRESNCPVCNAAFIPVNNAGRISFANNLAAFNENCPGRKCLNMIHVV